MQEIKKLAGVSRTKMQTIARLKINDFPALICIDASNKHQYNRKDVLDWLKKNNAKAIKAQPETPDNENSGRQQLDNKLALNFITGKMA